MSLQLHLQKSTKLSAHVDEADTTEVEQKHLRQDVAFAAAQVRQTVTAKRKSGVRTVFANHDATAAAVDEKVAAKHCASVAAVSKAVLSKVI